jgi:hypothetical protein
VCLVNNETTFITKLMYLKVFIANFQYNRPPTSHNAEDHYYRSSSARWKSYYETPSSNSVTTHWMSLISPKRSPFRASFTFGKRGKKSAGAKYTCRGVAGSHRLIWKQETTSHSTCGERARFNVTASSCCFGTARF